MTPCPHLWCVHGDPSHPRRFQRATCGRCRLTVTSLEAWSHVDDAAFVAAVDPDGIQREFIAACGAP